MDKVTYDMITEDYVSFETAKLLKEKGFDKAVLITDWWYDAEGQAHKRGNYSYGGAPFYDKETCFNCPTLQMAMKWLREAYHFHIMVDCIGSENYLPTIQFTHSCKDVKVESKTNKLGGNGFENYEKACEAAIKYCLENLI